MGNDSLEVTSRKEPEVRSFLHFIALPGEHLGKAIFQTACVFIQAFSIPAAGPAAVLLSGLLWVGVGFVCLGFFFNYIKAGGYCFGKQEVRVSYSSVWDVAAGTCLCFRGNRQLK